MWHDAAIDPAWRVRSDHRRWSKPTARRQISGNNDIAPLIALDYNDYQKSPPDDFAIEILFQSVLFICGGKLQHQVCRHDESNLDAGHHGAVGQGLGQMAFAHAAWTQKEVLEQLFVHYVNLDEDLRAELPLKQIWTVAAQKDEEV
ncbi:hypothetical protein C8R31_101150 [Nitrosospira sp. Nsp2]|nr:hypothetical protein C8R31_101150 [Nitrosospira sp. Nsp2]